MTIEREKRGIEWYSFAERLAPSIGRVMGYWGPQYTLHRGGRGTREWHYAAKQGSDSEELSSLSHQCHCHRHRWHQAISVMFGSPISMDFYHYNHRVLDNTGITLRILPKSLSTVL